MEGYIATLSMDWNGETTIYLYRRVKTGCLDKMTCTHNVNQVR